MNCVSFFKRRIDQDWENRFTESTENKEIKYKIGSKEYTLRLRYCTNTYEDGCKFITYEISTDQQMLKKGSPNYIKNESHPFIQICKSGNSDQIESDGNKLIVGGINNNNNVSDTLLKLIMTDDEMLSGINNNDILSKSFNKLIVMDDDTISQYSGYSDIESFRDFLTEQLCEYVKISKDRDQIQIFRAFLIKQLHDSWA
jgi:hypothetical protein